MYGDKCVYFNKGKPNICNNCNKRITVVKVIDFNKLTLHLLDYKYARVFNLKTKIGQKWKTFSTFWNNKVDIFNKNKNKKDLTLRSVKVSAKYLINKFRERDKTSFCPTYSAIYKHLKKNVTLLKTDILVSLSKGGYYKKNIKKAKKSLKNATDISKRPEAINNRSEFGHYELDTVIGTKSDKYCLLTLIERQTRDAYSIKSKRNANAIKESLLKLIKNNKIEIKTLTIDNGSENTQLYKVISIENLYKCHPYSSFKKGSIENMHRLIRRFIPKGKSIDKYSQREIEFMMKSINQYRKNLSIN